MKIQKLTELRGCLKPLKQLSYSSFWISGFLDASKKVSQMITTYNNFLQQSRKVLYF